jgi:hypothetical protein
MIRIPCYGTSGKDFGGLCGEAARVSSDEHRIALGSNGKKITVQ